jgi:hypothetical protein
MPHETPQERHPAMPPETHPAMTTEPPRLTPSKRRAGAGGKKFSVQISTEGMRVGE